jgi:hypothetical protein
MLLSVVLPRSENNQELNIQSMSEKKERLQHKSIVIEFRTSAMIIYHDNLLHLFVN